MYWTSPDFWQGFIAGVVFNVFIATVAWFTGKKIWRGSR